MPANKNKNKVILVTGATGHQGGAVVRHLREKGFTVRALTRDPDQPKARAITGQGVEVVRGDMDDKAVLTRALDEANGVFSVQNSHEAGIEGEIRQGLGVADAAKRSRISHFIYSSVASADQKTGIPHFDSKFRIEEHIRGTGMNFTIVRPVFFMENWLGMREMIENGALNLPLDPATRLQMIAVDDIGGVVAAAFERPGKWQGRTFEVAGDEMSMTELTQAFTLVTGHEVRYVQTPWDEFEQRAGKEITTMYRWFQAAGYHVDIGSVRQEYPGLTTFAKWLNSAWHTAARRAG
uniref:NmrA family protein n=1 Tax=Solibacter usitatus (strain Ellin6076) TaxID=234267 RepID=Q01SZ6_SOLUE